MPNRIPSATRPLLAFAVLPFLISPARAAPKPSASAAPSARSAECPGLPPPTALASKIAAADDRPAFLALFGMSLGSRPSPAWTCFIDKVERGDESLGPALGAMSKKPYWLAAPEVTEALSQALLTRPAFVLKIIAGSANPDRSTEVICQVDTPYGISLKEVDAAHKKVYKALGGVAEEDLAGRRQACFESLAHHFREWKDLRQLAGDSTQ